MLATVKEKKKVLKNGSDIHNYKMLPVRIVPYEARLDFFSIMGIYVAKSE